MTIPWMMNCRHSDEGWCLGCVTRQRHELETWRDLALSPFAKLLPESQQFAEGACYSVVDREMRRYDESLGQPLPQKDSQ